MNALHTRLAKISNELLMSKNGIWITQGGTVRMSGLTDLAAALIVIQMQVIRLYGFIRCCCLITHS
jgi:hypothetical protein